MANVTTRVIGALRSPVNFQTGEGLNDYTGSEEVIGITEQARKQIKLEKKQKKRKRSPASQLPRPKRRQPSNPGNAVAMVAAAQGVPYWAVMDKLGRVSRVPMEILTLGKHEAYMSRCAERRKGLLE